MKTLKEYLLTTFGTLLVAAGIYFFKFPNNFSIGGVTGISIILGKLITVVSPSTLVLIINVVLLGVGFLLLGTGFGFKTVYGSLLLSGTLMLFERLFPMTAPLTGQPVLELAYAVLLPAVGSAILFNVNASTGGTDIVAMILRKFTNVDIGKSLLATDFLVTVAAGLTFGIETGLFSVLGLIAKALVVDNVIESIRLSKYFTIITTKPEPICRYITGELHRGATVLEGRGSYTNKEHTVILTALYRNQAVHLQKKAREIDPEAFILITNTSQIIGKGFRGSL